MPETDEAVSKVDIDIPEITRDVQAIVFVWQGMKFLISNNKWKATFIFAVTIFVILQVFNNFSQFKTFLGLFGQ